MRFGGPGGLPCLDAREALHLALGAGFVGARASAAVAGADLPRALDALTLAAEAAVPLVAWVLGEPHPLVKLEGGPMLVLRGPQAGEAFELAERRSLPAAVLCGEEPPPPDGEERPVAGRSPSVLAKPLPPEAYFEGPADGGGFGAAFELAQALGRLGAGPEDAVLVTGSGCPEDFQRLKVRRLRAPSGALAAAQGAKLAAPGLLVAAALDASREPAHLAMALKRNADIACLSFGHQPPVTGLPEDPGAPEERVYRALRRKGFAFVLFP